MYEYHKRFYEIQETILSVLHERLYRYKRYDQEFTALMIYADKHTLQLHDFSQHLRQSDSSHQIRQNLLLVVFDMTDESTGLKAAQNFQYSYMQQNMHNELFYAMAPIREKDTAIDIASRLLIIMDFALSEGMNNTIVDLESMRH